MSTLSRVIECLQFESSGRSFCIDVDQVLGLISLPPHMRETSSSIPFNGGTIPVYTLEKILEMEERPRLTPPEIIVLRNETGNYGIAVDWVGEIHKVPIQRSIFRFPDSNRSRVKMFGVWGMANLGAKLALILEPLTLLEKVHNKKPLPAPPRGTKLGPGDHTKNVH